MLTTCVDDSRVDEPESLAFIHSRPINTDDATLIKKVHTLIGVKKAFVTAENAKDIRSLVWNLKPSHSHIVDSSRSSDNCAALGCRRDFDRVRDLCSWVSMECRDCDEESRWKVYFPLSKAQILAARCCIEWSFSHLNKENLLSQTPQTICLIYQVNLRTRFAWT